MSERQRYCLVSDSDGNDYVVPVERRDDFHLIAKAIDRYSVGGPACELIEPPPYLPEWAKQIESSLTFERPEVDGKADEAASAKDNQEHADK